jgi:hypothetical protein
MAFPSAKMPFEDLGFSFVAEFDLYDHALRCQIVFEPGWRASVGIKPAAHLGHFGQEVGCRRKPNDDRPHSDLISLRVVIHRAPPIATGSKYGEL